MITIESLAKGKFGLDHGFDSVIHILYEVFLRATKTALVGDIEDTIASIGVLTMASTDLNVVLICDALEARPVLHEVRQVDVDGSTKGCSKIGRARSDIANMIIVEELGFLFDGCGCAGKALKDSTDVSSWLH